VRPGCRRLALATWVAAAGAVGCAAATTRGQPDWRNLTNGFEIPSAGYCDQAYVVITHDRKWLAVLTTGKGREGDRGQHIASSISMDQGRTWSPLTPIEPADGPEASWATPLITPGGRVYVFYSYNGDQVRDLRNRSIRADMLGWYAFRYSDDHGRTWSKERHRLPVRITECDRTNDWRGAVQIFWGIDKPKADNGVVMFGFTKLGKYMLDFGEGWFFRSDNILAEPDVKQIRWQMLPEGETGLRAPELGSIQEEFNVVPLGGDRWYCLYRTTNGFPCHSYSHDGGRTWTRPEPATYTPGGRTIKNPRACPRLFKCANGRFLLWFHNHSGRTFESRNPAWIAGGALRGGYLHWSQPEILLYDDDVSTRMSYPDLVEQNGRYWLTETQKEICRVHPIQRELLDGLWTQGEPKQVTRSGLVLEADEERLKKEMLPSPRLPAPAARGGFTVELLVSFDDLSAGQVLLDNRDRGGKGLLLRTSQPPAVELVLSDGGRTNSWRCDTGLLTTNRIHHLGMVVDGGPRIVSFVVDGVVGDGGLERQYGWGRISPELTDLNGESETRIAPSLMGRLLVLRLYDRPLRHAELVANCHAGLRGR
jgi:hypothetical protein